MNPIPSMSIAHFEVDPKQGKLTAGYTIRKHTPLFAHSPQGQTCRLPNLLPGDPYGRWN